MSGQPVGVPGRPRRAPQYALIPMEIDVCNVIYLSRGAGFFDARDDLHPEDTGNLLRINE